MIKPTRFTHVSNDVFQLFKSLLVFLMYIKALKGAVVLRLEHRALCLLKVLPNEQYSRTEILLLLHLFIDDHVNCSHSLAMMENTVRNMGVRPSSLWCDDFNSFDQILRSKTDYWIIWQFFVFVVLETEWGPCTHSYHWPTFSFVYEKPP